MTVSQSGVREFLWLVKETALGVRTVSPVPGTDSIFIRLSEGQFGMFENPILKRISYGGGLAVNVQTVSDHYEARGSLKTELYPSQAPFLMGWGLTRINSGQTSPWTTTEPVGDLASCTAYHGYQYADGSFARKRFRAVKVASLGLDVSRSSTTAVLSLDLLGGQVVGSAFDGTPDPDATEFPAPTEAMYPTESPYTFHMSAGGFTVASVRTQYEDFSFKVTNAMDGLWFEGSYLSLIKFCGRDASADIDLLLKASPDDRSPFEAITAAASSIVFTNGVSGQNMTIQLNSNNIRTALPLNLANGKAFFQKLTLSNQFDGAALSGAGQDLSVSFA